MIDTDPRHKDVARVKEISFTCENADEMKAKVTAEYPDYNGLNYLDMTVNFFFPAK